MTAIKICGITSLPDALSAAELGADALGFNFFGPSPRYVRPEEAARIIERLPPGIRRVGLFVNADRKFIEEIVRTSGIDTVQLHGAEPPELCTGWGAVTVMKAVRLDDTGVFHPDPRAYLPHIGYLLVDRYNDKAFGGTGVEHDPAMLRSVRDAWKDVPTFLAGGLRDSNVGNLIRELHPFGVDVSSGVEESPGKKSRELMRSFIGAVRDADGSGAQG